MEDLSVPVQLWVGGKYQPGRGELIPIEDPSTGTVFAHAHSASPDDVDAAVAAAHAAFHAGTWSRAPRHARADVLDRCAALLPAALPALIALEVRQTGRAVRELRAQLPTLARWFRYYAALLRAAPHGAALLLPQQQNQQQQQQLLHSWAERRPLGVVALITPFNHPLLIAVKKLAPALAAGNAVVLKPSELAPLTALRLGALLRDAGVPAGVLSVLPGGGATAARALAAHPLVRRVDVTGGAAAGRALGAAAGARLARFAAELGGKAPLVVFADADADVAVNGIAFGAFVASGQTCVAAARIIVANGIMDAVVERLVAKAESITRRMGAPSNPASTMGPLISEKQLKNVEALVHEATESGDASCKYGGVRMRDKSLLDGTDFAKGYFFMPSVLTSVLGNSILKTRIWKEEAFGPVVAVVGFDTEEEAIELANDSEYGLGAAVWTKDLSRAYRVSEQIDAGIVWVNTHHRNDPSSPWGGTKSASGVGSENGVDAFNDYTMLKSTIINTASAEQALATDDWFGEGGGSVRYG